MGSTQSPIAHTNQQNLTRSTTSPKSTVRGWRIADAICRSEYGISVLFSFLNGMHLRNITEDWSHVDFINPSLVSS